MALRWEGDERGFGVSNGNALLPDLERLRAAMREDDWVTEHPEAHLLPHIQRACRAAGSSFTMQGAGYEGDVYVVGLSWSGDDTPNAIRRAAWDLVARIAELSTYVRERRIDGGVEFDVTTGMLDGDSDFRSHGHLLRLRVASS
jgi:hypothetical protein